MAEATCRREIELEIPAENVQKADGKSCARYCARGARSGISPGQSARDSDPPALRRRIQGEVLQSLVPEYLEKALDEKKLIPVTRPQVDKVDFKEGGPLKFRATFEVLPEFELGDYKNLEVEVEDVEVGDAEVDKALEEMRERARDVRSRRRTRGERWRLRPDQADGHARRRRRSGAGRQMSRATLAPKKHWKLSTRICAARVPGETKQFRSEYPDDYPDPKLAGKSVRLCRRSSRASRKRSCPS